MSYNDDGLVVLLSGFEEEIMQFLFGFAIKVAAWFVCKDNFWGVDHCSGNGNTLLFSAAEFCRAGVLFSAEAQLIKKLLCMLFYLLVR